MRLKELMRGLELSSVCEEAHCPNIGECWEAGTATFLIMGDVCTRNCPYCAIAHGRPEGLDEDEPRRVAEAIERLQLNHCVITSVDRDDLPDGGAWIFGEMIREIRLRRPRVLDRGADAGFPGQPGGDPYGDRCRAGDLQPQHGDGAPTAPRRAGQGGRYDRSARTVLRTGRRAGRPGAHQDRHHAGAGRDRRGYRRVHGRCAGGGRTDPDAGSVPSAVAGPSPDSTAT